LLDQRLLLRELLSGGLELGIIGGVHIVAQKIFRDAESVPGVTEHENFSAVFLVPQKLPAGYIRLIDVFGVVNNADGAPGIGNGILVFRVVAGVFVHFVNVLVVGNVVEIE